MVSSYGRDAVMRAELHKQRMPDQAVRASAANSHTLRDSHRNRSGLRTNTRTRSTNASSQGFTYNAQTYPQTRRVDPAVRRPAPSYRSTASLRNNSRQIPSTSTSRIGYSIPYMQDKDIPMSQVSELTDQTLLYGSQQGRSLPSQSQHRSEQAVIGGHACGSAHTHVHAHGLSSVVGTSRATDSQSALGSKFRSACNFSGGARSYAGTVNASAVAFATEVTPNPPNSRVALPTFTAPTSAGDRIMSHLRKYRATGHLSPALQNPTCASFAPSNLNSTVTRPPSQSTQSETRRQLSTPLITTTTFQPAIKPFFPTDASMGSHTSYSVHALGQPSHTQSQNSREGFESHQKSHGFSRPSISHSDECRMSFVASHSDHTIARSQSSRISHPTSSRTTYTKLAQPGDHVLTNPDTMNRHSIAHAEMAKAVSNQSQFESQAAALRELIQMAHNQIGEKVKSELEMVGQKVNSHLEDFHRQKGTIDAMLDKTYTQHQARVEFYEAKSRELDQKAANAMNDIDDRREAAVKTLKDTLSSVVTKIQDIGTDISNGLHNHPVVGKIKVFVAGVLKAKDATKHDTACEKRQRVEVSPSSFTENKLHTVGSPTSTMGKPSSCSKASTQTSSKTSPSFISSVASRTKSSSNQQRFVLSPLQLSQNSRHLNPKRNAYEMLNSQRDKDRVVTPYDSSASKSDPRSSSSKRKRNKKARIASRFPNLLADDDCGFLS